MVILVVILTLGHTVVSSPFHPGGILHHLYQKPGKHFPAPPRTLLPAMGRRTKEEGWFIPGAGFTEHLKLNTENSLKTPEISLFTTLKQPRTHRKQATRPAHASHRWWTKSRCDSVCLRSRHFMAWLCRGPAHDAIAIQTTQLSQCFTQLHA